MTSGNIELNKLINDLVNNVDNHHLHFSLEESNIPTKTQPLVKYLLEWRANNIPLHPLKIGVGAEGRLSCSSFLAVPVSIAHPELLYTGLFDPFNPRVNIWMRKNKLRGKEKAVKNFIKTKVFKSDFNTIIDCLNDINIQAGGVLSHFKVEIYGIRRSLDPTD